MEINFYVIKMIGHDNVCMLFTHRHNNKPNVRARPISIDENVVIISQ